MQRLGAAGWYSGSRPNGMTNTETILMKHAEDALNEALRQTNNFFENDWKTYKTRLEDVFGNGPFTIIRRHCTQYIIIRHIQMKTYKAGNEYQFKTVG